jgi:hypothetical protein
MGGCCCAQAKQQEANCGGGSGWAESTAHFLRQMGYREYGRYLSFHFPFTHERSLLEHLRAAPWNYDQRLFKARAPRCHTRLRLHASQDAMKDGHAARCLSALSQGSHGLGVGRNCGCGLSKH